MKHPHPINKHSINNNSSNRHLYKSDQKLDELKIKQDDYDDDEEYYSDTERDSWIMLSHDSDNNYQYDPIQTYNEEPQKEIYTNIKQYYKIHKPKKINSCFKYVIKCMFSYYQIQYHKSDIELCKSFAMLSRLIHIISLHYILYIIYYINKIKGKSSGNCIQWGFGKE